MSRITVSLHVLFMLASLGVCRGDSWGPPSAKIFASDDGNRALKIVPIRGEGFTFTSTATWIRLNHDGSEQALNQFKLPNAPMRILIPERGVNFFVTIDSHARLGGDHTLVIYRSGGQVVRDLKLENLLTATEILDHVKHTVSSRWWREGAAFVFEVPTTETIVDKGRFVRSEYEEAKLHLVFPWGKRVVVKLATGEVLP